MPSPIGHLLAGVATAWTADLIPAWRHVATRPRMARARASWTWRMGGPWVLIAAALAAAPDLDLLVGGHRTVTHSITAAVLVAIAAAILVGRGHVPRPHAAIFCGAAYATHLLLDWLGADRVPPRGIQLLWPFSHQWFISGWELFLGTERRRIFTAAAMRRNGAAAVREVAVLGPVLLVLWFLRTRRHRD